MTTSVQIHPTAIIEQGAEIDSGVTIGPYALIGPHVKIGRNSKIHGHAVVTGHTFLGEENEVFSFASVGNRPQDLKYKGEPTELIVGSRNIIRECVTLQPGTVQGGGKTTIGSQNLFMAYSHVAHDCIIGDLNVIANAVQIAGHVTIDNMAIIGGLCAIHQFVHIGDMAMLGGGSATVKDIPPYCVSEGNRAILRGLNVEGMKRRNISPEARTAVKNAYKIMFLKGHPTLEAAYMDIGDLIKFPEVEKFITFIKNAKRGISHPSQNANELNNEE
ncbi:acyl-ACP--UDP-N-acetylglucosamine O-acyltransferase [Pigmentibacter ruber]|uniref:acyl-ACP--UDP-N-acetylglucosamine O-acyltransferase n=1 Tax=Pigmentibacter ruber TaxID=2683196 RepID=UPI00131BCC88|nr:acyl-ACP--UDP-N-acetylglucosamine O-acyltransferase [Pigmentibacter ruber]BFD30851.1 acyl-ACP--UDP-N-acetylglucosamine O-acyltransferase [Pigmentibacter ruber]